MPDPFVSETTVRLATSLEREPLEYLQRRASLVADAYREKLLAHPDAIDLPLEQIEAGQVHVAERSGAVVGFCVVLPRLDGDVELDGLFVEPDCWKQGIGRLLVAHAEAVRAGNGRAPFVGRGQS
ncbi:GNAT family N-acetyltransferase [Aminobacter sp. UC22_36]|uniref:GNAT family N-acetyltransferase n=1 Tax=Aminobacter sp. UC22_36 TaxID=3374549 RepID=UPI0037575EDF